jgi:DNA-binding transcriptional LysR family regulator
MQNWDDLRVFLVAARHETLSGAALDLGVDAATVGRRIARLESAMRSTLMVRSPAGVELTASGLRLKELGLEAETAVVGALQGLDGENTGGTVRISASEGFGTEILAPALAAFRIERPSIRIELAAHAGFLSATTREVDLVITLSPPKSSRLNVEPLAQYELGLYGSRDYLDRVGAPSSKHDLKRLEFVGYIDDMIYAPELRYLDEIEPSLRPSLSSSSIRAQKAIIEAGGGIGILPAFMAQGLTRILGRDLRLRRRFWMGVYKDSQGTVRMRAVSAWIRDLVQKNNGRLNPDA